MKKAFKVVGFIVLPVLATVILSLVAQVVVSAPTTVTPIPDTGERWWSPFTWALDESAQHATMQANSALSASISYTKLMAIVGAMVAGVGLTLLVMAIRQGWVGAESKAVIEQAAAAASTPPQKGPKTADPTTSRSTSSEDDDERDPALTGRPMATATTT